MKRFKKLSAVLLALILLLSDIPIVRAYERDEHDRMTEDVLFKNFKVIDNDLSVLDEINALESAAYLTIDQFNANGQGDLTALKTFGVKKLPKLRDIDYPSSGAYHRRATHRGWTAEIGVYDGEVLERWLLRKEILISTVEKIFDFKGDEAKKDSFCALIYYIHILGDRIDDTKYYPNAEIMELGGRTDEQDIACELLKYIEILFEDQKHTHKYQHVVSKLEILDSGIKELLKSQPSGLMSGETFTKYQEYAEDMREVLTCNLPEMLKDEDFFSELFYRKD